MRKRIVGVAAAVIVMASTLSGCIIVDRGWDDGGYRHHRHGGYYGDRR